jgi:metallo-beta-lactamase family protein
MPSTMRIEFLGAAGTVTGSRTLIRSSGKRYLVDCGLFQGPRENRERNWNPFPEPASSIEAVLLTHAHLDHSGLLPRLCKEGFKGPIYCSAGTADLCEILWRDSAKLQEEDAAYANKTGHSRHKPAHPLYDTRDVEQALSLLKPSVVGKNIAFAPNLSFTLREAGHIIGANFIELNATVGQRSWRICFSGDLGHERQLTLRGPESPSKYDLLILESTYGDREHDRQNSLEQLARHLRETCGRGGVLMIPSFAVGRTQELIYMIRQIEDKSLAPSYPVILDSPMANKATDIYLNHRKDHQVRDDFRHINRESFFPKQFEAIESVDDSFMACLREGPLVVIAGAGMLSGGRILHHLKKRLPEEINRLLFVGFQGEGSKGRYLLEQGKATGFIRIHHREIEVKSEIENLNSLSAHGDRLDLLSWLGNSSETSPHIMLNHGEPEACIAFQEFLQAKIPSLHVDIADQAKAIVFDEKKISLVNTSTAM